MGRNGSIENCRPTFLCYLYSNHELFYASGGPILCIRAYLDSPKIYTNGSFKPRKISISFPLTSLVYPKLSLKCLFQLTPFPPHFCPDSTETARTPDQGGSQGFLSCQELACPRIQVLSFGASLPGGFRLEMSFLVSRLKPISFP